MAVCSIRDIHPRLGQQRPFLCIVKVMEGTALLLVVDLHITPGREIDCEGNSSKFCKIVILVSFFNGMFIEIFKWVYLYWVCR